jgi:hypothetical protein
VARPGVFRDEYKLSFASTEPSTRTGTEPSTQIVSVLVAP